MTGQNVKFSMSDYSDGRIQIHIKSYLQFVLFIVFINQHTVKSSFYIIPILSYVR